MNTWTVTGLATLLSATVLSATVPFVSAGACTRVFWNDNGKAKVVGRSMDLFRSDEARIAVTPRGVSRSSAPNGGTPLTWTTEYGSVAVTAFGGAATSDGMNERGLVANLLYLGNEIYEQRDDRPGLSNADWAKYVLDRFATVNQALAGLQKVQVVSAKVAGQEWPLHLSISDAGGDSAVIEFVNGKMVVHHGPDVRVMTNEPSYDQQLANLARYKAFGGKLPLPGDIDPRSRFIRASTFLKTLPPPAGELNAVAGAYDVIRNVAVPPGAVDTSGQEDTSDTWETRWITVSNATDKRYYFQSTTSPFAYWVDLTKINLSPGQPTYDIDAYNRSLSGDITSRLSSLSGHNTNPPKD